MCFFYKTNDDGTLVYPKRYFGISHVGLMISKDKFLNITSYPASGNLIVTNVTARAPFLYARPLYGSITRGASGDLTAGVTDLIPDVPSGIPQGTSNNNGLTITMTGKKMLLVDNETNQPIRLHDLMDFNRAFQQYDTLDGANCLTVGKRNLSQREAAMEAVQAIGLNQICDVESAVFARYEEYGAMFSSRLEEMTSEFV